MKLKGKSAVVTGGAMGIGLATTKRLLSEGCQVTIWDINRGAILSAQKELSQYETSVFFHECDISNREQVYKLGKIAEKEMGRVDILINNAGHVAAGGILDYPDDVWEKTISVNLTSMIYTTRAFLPQMYERNSGHIVNISSASAAVGVPRLAVYTATKWAVWGLTESLRFEAIRAEKTGVQYSSIHPSYIMEGMFKGARLGFWGRLLAPGIKDHDVIAKAIVLSALKRKRYSPKRPRSVNSVVRFRAALPDFLFQKLAMFMGVHKSMDDWVGRGKTPD